MAEDFCSFVVLYKTVPCWPKKESLWPEQENCSGVVCVCQRVNSARLRFGSDPVKSRCGTERAGPVKSGKAKENPIFQWEDGEVYKGASREKRVPNVRRLQQYEYDWKDGFRLFLGLCSVEREIGVESVLWNGWPDLWTMATGSLLLCGSVSRT